MMISSSPLPNARLLAEPPAVGECAATTGCGRWKDTLVDSFLRLALLVPDESRFGARETANGLGLATMLLKL